MDLSRRYTDSNGNKCDILQMVSREPEWAANRLQAGEEALKKVIILEEEGERDRAHGRDFIRLWREGKERIAVLEAAIIKTLNENGHLADGEDCTLIELKRVMPTWGARR